MTIQLLGKQFTRKINDTYRGDLIVPRTKTVRYGPRSFAVSGPSSWNNLPSSVRQRIHYKLASLAFRALSGLAPDYLADDCQLVAVSGQRPLRSAERRVCHVPRQNSTFGDRSFAVAGPRTWNYLRNENENYYKRKNEN